MLTANTHTTIHIIYRCHHYHHHHYNTTAPTGQARAAAVPAVRRLLVKPHVLDLLLVRVRHGVVDHPPRRRTRAARGDHVERAELEHHFPVPTSSLLGLDAVERHAGIVCVDEARTRARQHAPRGVIRPTAELRGERRVE